ncbi:hypothetical protein NAC44_15440 [Allorhizobium sp. BGMRC 0089]|uniref:hypothetical protein n=1 Tax=Allorhizobium sonneratiae TaxID=2934936 RepID=UPI0020332166|nr:hypothetical protein [Allorhizobium sonneratiae]MCM2293722.1 hypothetical protein [Allorhizobium sonneratiae]
MILLAATGLCILSSLMVYGSAPLGKLLLRNGHSDSTVKRSITIGLDHLTLEDNSIRFQRQRHDGVMGRIDLELLWPEMRGFSNADRLRFDDINQADGLIFLQLSQSTMSRDMSGRVEPIYSQLFSGPPEAGPYGLTLHHFRKGSGYDGEVLYTARTPEGKYFAIRCLIIDDIAANGGDACQRDVHVGKDLSLLYRYSRARLKDWQAIETSLGAYVDRHLVDAAPIH